MTGVLLAYINEKKEVGQICVCVALGFPDYDRSEIGGQPAIASL